MDKFKLYFWRSLNRFCARAAGYAQRGYARSEKVFISKQLRSRKEMC